MSLRDIAPFKERPAAGLRPFEFYRSLTLPSAVKPGGAKAVYKDGVLEIKLPKSDEAKPNKVLIV